MATEKKKIKPLIAVEEEKSAFSYCTLVKVPEPSFAPEVSPHRAAMIMLHLKKWVNGTKLMYYFFDNAQDGSPVGWRGSEAQRNVVRQAFRTWKNLGIGLAFEETNDRMEAQVRIGFQVGDGSWSYVGRDVIDYVSSPNERTMNFGWNISNEPDTALHEVGHTLGAPHEHQNPFAGIVWNEPAVYAALAAPPNNWDRATTFNNIIRKLPLNEVNGSTHDPNSIMHYPFGPGLIDQPVDYRNGIQPRGGLSDLDKEYMRKFYPPLNQEDYSELKVAISQPMDIEPGQQRNFIFRPTRSRKYKIETFGTMDTVMVLFERVNGEDIYLSGDDDSGKALNSMINLRLIKGREYVIRVRLYYAEAEGSGSVMIY